MLELTVLRAQFHGFVCKCVVLDFELVDAVFGLHQVVVLVLDGDQFVA